MLCNEKMFHLGKFVLLSCFYDYRRLEWRVVPFNVLYEKNGGCFFWGDIQLFKLWMSVVRAVLWMPQAVSAKPRYPTNLFLTMLVSMSSVVLFPSSMSMQEYRNRSIVTHGNPHDNTYHCSAHSRHAKYQTNQRF